MFMGWANLIFPWQFNSLVFPVAKIAPSHSNFTIKKEKFASEK